VLQLPLNLFEAGAAVERNHGAQTVLEHALAHDVAVLANRPLNALVGGSMLRLSGVEVPVPGVELEPQLAVLADLEDEYRREIAPRLRAAEGSVPPSEFFRWSRELAGAADQLKGREHWQQVQAQRVMPVLHSAIQALDQALTGPLAEPWRAWRERYLGALHDALLELGRRAALWSRRAVEGVEDTLERHLPPSRAGQSLSRKALWVVASTPGVSAALVGMRRPEYVDDALGILAWPRLETAEVVYEAMREAAPAEPGA
jgi:hypothetical protein